MRIGYVDTSCLVAIAFGERGAGTLARRLEGFDELIAANLLEAELKAAFAREGVEPSEDLLSAISWVIPDRLLHAEIAKVLAEGYIRGADCWHLATALFLTDNPAEVHFLTLDQRQRKVARALGFKE